MVASGYAVKWSFKACCGYGLKSQCMCASGKWAKIQDLYSWIDIEERAMNERDAREWLSVLSTWTNRLLKCSGVERISSSLFVVFSISLRN